MTYITRAQIGLRSPNGSHSLVPSQVLNTAFHYPGMASPIDATGAAGLRRVCSALRGWQTYHMDTRGWSDIAYCLGIDQVGRKYTLRGINIRSAANGGTQVNLNYGAVLLILGNNEEPSAAMAAAAREVMGDYRARFTRVPKRPTWHGAIRPGGTADDPSTDCPGKRAIAQIKAGKFDAGSTPVVPTTPTPPKDEDMPLNQADKDFITGECQRFAVANNEYYRQLSGTQTKLILAEINEVDEETATKVAVLLDKEAEKLQAKFLSDTATPQ
jgi:hypothetical protein